MDAAFPEQLNPATGFQKAAFHSPPMALEVLSFVDSASRRFSIPALLPPIQKLSEYTQDSGSLDIALLGRFKAGKSSLLNNLLGMEILPTDVLPATAVVTRVWAGVSDQLTIHYRNGRVENASPSLLVQYATEKGNPSNQKEVLRVDVELESIGAWEGVRWVDSPGIGSLHAHNTAATWDWLPKVGVAMVAVSVDQPLSEEDLVLIRKLEEQTPEIMILLTKADLVSPEQLKSVVQYVGSQLRVNLGRELPVFPVSIRPGYENSVSDLKNVLQTKQQGSLAGGEDRIIRHKLKALLKSCHGYLEFSLQASHSGAQARERFSQALEEEWSFLSTMENEFPLAVNQTSLRIRQSLEGCFVSKLQELAGKFQEDLVVKLREWRGNLAEESRWYREWLESRLVLELDRLGRENQEVWKSHVREAEDTLNRDLRAFRDRISLKVREALQFEYAGVAFEANPASLEIPSTYIGLVFDTAFENIWFLIPMLIFRPLVHRHFLGSLSWQVEKHLYRLTSEWTERVKDSIQGMMEKAEKYICDELESLEHLLREKTDDSGNIEKDLARLTELQKLVC